MYRADEDTWMEGPFRTGALSVDDAFRVLADRRRRLVVTSLLVSVGGVPIDDLVEDVMVHTDVPADDSADARTRIATELYHVHLPKLADAGFVEWDREREFVTPTAYLPALEPLVGGATLARFYR